MRAVVYQEVNLQPNKKYKLRFKVKTGNKTGIAKVRIIEEVGDKKQFWNSSEFKGTEDWKTVETDYSPTLSVNKIKLELFYETGTGTVSFKDVELVEAPISQLTNLKHLKRV